MRAPFAALAFLTRLPSPFRTTPADLARAPAFFSWVGAFIGCALASVHYVLPRSSPLLDATLVIFIGVFFTGALHEDGLADAADGLLGGATRERAFEIMKDPRLGTFGALALASSVGLRVAALALLAAPLSALVLAHALSRGLCTFVMATTPYVSPSDRARNGVFGSVGIGQCVVAFAPTALLVLAPQPSLRPLAFAATAAIVGALVVAATARRVLGGHTGDVLGAIQQVAEASSLVAYALATASRVVEEP